MLPLGLFAVGIAWIAASLQVYLRDTAQVLVVILTLWFWVTPIFIGADRFPLWARPVLLANPLAYIVDAYQHVLLGNAVPPMRDLGASLAFALAAFVCGGLFFRHLKRGFADVL
jgi:lipopolysaccharide transport system permease protein